MLDDAAVASEGEFDAIMGLAKELLGNQAQPKALTETGPTFRAIGEDWTLGRLNARFPDHVKLKRSADRDSDRLDKLYETIGAVPITRFRLTDAERAMTALPKDLSSATRRQYAQLVSKVLRLAVYPLKAIERSPLPTGFLPKVKSTKGAQLPLSGRRRAAAQGTGGQGAARSPALVWVLEP